MHSISYENDDTPLEEEFKISYNTQQKHQEQIKLFSKIQSFKQSGDVFFSLEISPPSFDKRLNFFERLLSFLKESIPLFLSVTNISNITPTLELSSFLANYCGQFVLFHLVGSQLKDENDLIRILEKGSALNLTNFLALRGDNPVEKSKFPYALNLINSVRNLSNSEWNIAVGGYPDALDLNQDIYFLKKKICAGADIIITQLFYDAEILINFVKSCRINDIDSPIIAGFMPLQNYKITLKISSLTRIPLPLNIKEGLKLVEGRPESERKFALDHSVSCLKEVLKARCVVGIHFFTLNRFELIPEILQGLGLGKLQIEYPYLLLK